jgi:cytochrome c-type biogenesis protein CcmH/NrfF
MISPRALCRRYPASKPSLLPVLRRSLAVLVAAAALVTAAAVSSPALAEGAPPQLSEQERDREAESIARTVMSPFCPGRTLSSCPNAGPWREDIRKWVGEGVSAEEIRRRLYERVPETNLTGTPPNRLGWFLPIGAALLAVGGLVVAMRVLVKPQPPPPPGKAIEPAPVNANSNADGAEGGSKKKEDYDARLEEELEDIDQP